MTHMSVIGVEHRSGSVEVKKKTILFRTPVLVVRHMSYECHGSVRHLDTPSPRGVRAS